MTGHQVVALVRPLGSAIRWQPGLAAWGLVALLLVLEDGALDDPGSALLLLRAVAVIAVLGAAFVLDDEAALTLEASPSTLAWRRFLRVAAAVALVTPPWVGAVWRLDAHATRLPVEGLTLELIALLVLALAVAAAVTRWSASTDPGVATTPAVFVVVLGAFQLPPKFALYGVPGPGWESAHVRWWALLATATLLLLWCGRDPAARRPWSSPRWVAGG
jgi:hypothetical protein